MDDSVRERMRDISAPMSRRRPKTRMSRSVVASYVSAPVSSYMPSAKSVASSGEMLLRSLMSSSTIMVVTAPTGA